MVGAGWLEINFAERLWTVPAERMKPGKEHRVPLSAPAIAILEEMQKIRHNDFVFPGTKARRPLSNMSMLMLLRRMGRSDLTAHGFRSTFSDWCSETLTLKRNHDRKTGDTFRVVSATSPSEAVRD